MEYKEYHEIIGTAIHSFGAWYDGYGTLSNALEWSELAIVACREWIPNAPEGRSKNWAKIALRNWKMRFKVLSRAQFQNAEIMAMARAEIKIRRLFRGE